MKPTQTPVPGAQLPTVEDLVVISRELAGYRFLAQHVTPQAEVLLLNPARDGLAAISQLLRALPPIGRVHLIAPGNVEGLRLGSVSLRYNTLPNYASTLCQWRSHLAPSAEILIYNGEVARTEAGQLLIDVLHYLTGAAIAACTTPPNAVFPEGRWELDCATQVFEPVLAFPPAVVAQIQSQIPSKRGERRLIGEGVAIAQAPISSQKAMDCNRYRLPAPCIS
jgi:hypothetical protein